MKSIYEISFGKVKAFLDLESMDVFKDFIQWYYDFKVFTKKKIKVLDSQRLHTPSEAKEKFLKHFKWEPLKMHVEEDNTWRNIMT